jgi:hypothetical protein
VSEGVDIRRLRVVVHLTNRLTLLSFRQIVGRVVRTDSRNVDDHGRIYLPADPTLVGMATTITEEVASLPPPMTIVIDSLRAQRVAVQAGDAVPSIEFESLASVGERGGASDTSGHRADPELVALAAAYIRRRKLSATDPVSLALAASEMPQLRAALEEEARRS